MPIDENKVDDDLTFLSTSTSMATSTDSNESTNDIQEFNVDTTDSTTHAANHDQPPANVLLIELDRDDEFENNESEEDDEERQNQDQRIPLIITRNNNAFDTPPESDNDDDDEHGPDFYAFLVAP